MKNKILKTISLAMMVWPTIMFSQYVFKNNSITKFACETVKIVASRSAIGYIPVEKPVTWQYREDNGIWQNFDRPDCDTLVFEMKNDIAIRYNVQWCSKVYTSPETSFTTTDIIEGEGFVTDYGNYKYAWAANVKVSDASLLPRIDSNDPGASGRQLYMPFLSTYTGPFSVEYKARAHHAGNYRLAWQASNRPSGKVAWYVNEIKVGEYDNDKWGGTTPYIVLSGALAGPKNGTDKYGYSYNSSGYRLSKDKTMNYVEFPFTLNKDTTITIKAVWNKGQGSSSSRGLQIDQIRIVPMAQ